MKTLAAFTVILCLFGQIACQNAAAVKTLLVTGESVNSAMNVYGALYRANALTADEVTKVRAAHAKFQLAFSEAVTLARSDLSKLTPTEVGLLASDLIVTIYALKNAHSNVATP